MNEEISKENLMKEEWKVIKGFEQAVVGMDQPEYAHIFRTQFASDKSKYNPKKVEEVMVAAAKQLVSENKIGAIVL